MTKKQKIEYINEVYTRFTDTHNHGNQGDNWWYPMPNTIAYNVKMHSFVDVESLRKELTARQNDYYSDDTLYKIMSEDITDNANMLSDDIQEEYKLENGYAGRSNGWIEVEYVNNLFILDEDTEEDVNALYKEAKALEQLESDVCEFIKKRHKALNAYIDTPQYYKDMVERLTSDEEIADIYKDKITALTHKLK